ncbi:MAG: hypothetical protein AAGL17_23860, partial [Cyanobacteria bacterium J06576_12]
MRGRDEQLEQILAWATDETTPKCSMMLVSGPGGSGKTRLAVEAASILVDTHGWKGGFLPNSLRDRSKAKDFARVFEGSANGTVLLIDYPEERTSLVEEIYKSINDDEVRCKSKIRIILASRENRETWARKLNDQALHHFHETNLAPASSLDLDTALSIASDVGIRFSRELNVSFKPFVGAKEWLQKDRSHRLPLMVVAAAVHGVLDPKFAFKLDGAELLKAVAEFELKRVRSYSVRDFDKDTVLEKLVALAVLTQDGLKSETILQLGQSGIFPNNDGQALIE